MSEEIGTAKNSANPADSQSNQRAPAASDPDVTIESSMLANVSAATAPAVGHSNSIGAYQLIRKLGEGGMGQVWLAQQTVPVKRTVALKLIRVGRYDEEVLERFQAERQSLAMMDHPAIAKIFDAGTTPEGQPDFVGVRPRRLHQPILRPEAASNQRAPGAVHQSLRRRATRAPEGRHSP